MAKTYNTNNYAMGSLDPEYQEKLVDGFNENAKDYYDKSLKQSAGAGAGILGLLAVALFKDEIKDGIGWVAGKVKGIFKGKEDVVDADDDEFIDAEEI